MYNIIIYGYFWRLFTSGIAGEKFKNKGSELAEDQINQMSKQLESFQNNLQEFAAKHRSKFIMVELKKWKDRSHCFSLIIILIR